MEVLAEQMSWSWQEPSAQVLPVVGTHLAPTAAMQLALLEAEKGRGFVAPNPLVGCTIVDREHRFLSVGYHARLGGDHAEIDALKKLPFAEDQRQEQLRGAHLYVTLEPCAHHGRTPPCASHLARYPFASVTYGLADPNPRVNGQGVEILRQAGIATSSVAEASAFADHDKQQLLAALEELAEAFLWATRQGSPFVALKVASSLDGQMAMQSGQSQWITGEAARLQAQRLRADFQAVLVGARTVLLDDPQLNLRLPEFAGRKNNVVILDPRGRLAPVLSSRKLWQVRAPENIYLFTSVQAMASAPVAALKDAGARVFPLSGGVPDLQSEVLRPLSAAGLHSIFVEGGAQVLSWFLAQQAAQRLHVFLAAKLIGGGAGLGWSSGFNIENLGKAVRLQRIRLHPCGEDVRLSCQISMQQ